MGRGRTLAWLMGTVIVIGVGGTLSLWTFTGDQTSKHLVASLQGLLQPESLPEGFTSGNGRIEATELDVATKLAGRVEAVLAQEGDTVAADQVLVRLDSETLEAQLRQARAELRRAQEDREYALAIVAQRESEREFAQNDLRRVLELAQTKHVSEEQVDQARTQSRTAEAALRAAQIKVAETEAAIAAAEAQVDRIQADIDDCELRAPRRGRVLYRLVEPGEVLGIGGKALTLLDLTDVYMVLFLPETVAGRVPIGAAVRIVLDAAPEYVIPARISFVAARAQFTPKQVETRSEREKLVFRAKARIDPQLLRAKEPFVKTGVPGVAYVQLRSTAEWPPWLAVRLP